jgi:quinol monooxygenase YgiN
MVVEYIRYKLDASQRETFIEAYRKAFKQLDASPHCLSYELTECAEEAGIFILRIEWNSREDHLQGFRKSALFAEFFAHVKAFFNNIEEMRHYHLVES